MRDKLSAPVRVGVVGCGGASQIIHLPILSRNPKVELRAVCDIDIRKASVIANRFSIPHVFGEIEEMVSHVELDAVFIVTPNNMHLPMSLIALREGLHVFIERPAARNAAETRRIARTADEHDCSVMVGMNSRFREDIRQLKDIIARKTLGDVFLIKSDWLQAKFIASKQPWWLSKRIAGGGVLLDLGSQLIDTSWWLTGRPRLESVKAISQQINPDIDVDDCCCFLMTFSNKLKLACHISWYFPIRSDRFHAEIYAQHGYSTLNPYRVETTWRDKFKDITPSAPTDGRTLFNLAYESEISHFINYLLGDEPELNSDIHEALQVMEMLELTYQSLEKGKEIIVNGTQAKK